jgi:hypothetical protein
MSLTNIQKNSKMTDKITINFPAYCYWIRSNVYRIDNDLIALGCNILSISEDGLWIKAKVPDHWYFISKGDRHIEIYNDKEYTQLIGVIKENMNTARMITVFEDRGTLADRMNNYYTPIAIKPLPIEKEGQINLF